MEQTGGERLAPSSSCLKLQAYPNNSSPWQPQGAGSRALSLATPFLLHGQAESPDLSSLLNTLEQLEKAWL